MNESNTISTLYKFEYIDETLNLQIMEEIIKAKNKGINYFIIGDSSNKTNGFKRGSLISSVIYNLRNIKNEAKDINIALKNTYEDINFYKTILEKVPGVKFYFDEDYAYKYSSNSIEEWKKFMSEYQ